MTPEEWRRALISLWIGIATSILTIIMQWLAGVQAELLAPATGGAAATVHAWRHFIQNIV